MVADMGEVVLVANVAEIGWKPGQGLTVSVPFSVPVLIFFPFPSRYGRMTVIPTGFVLQTILGLAVPFVPNYYGSLVLRFLLGAVAGGTYTICFVQCKFTVLSV